MLAQNFKTAADLRISEAGHGALIKVLGMLERGEIKHQPILDFYEPLTRITRAVGFNMFDFYSRGDCGTVCCLCGWAEVVGELEPFSLAAERLKNHALDVLFEPDRSLSPREDITATEAAAALRSYLSTGEANWAEALSSQ